MQLHHAIVSVSISLLSHNETFHRMFYHPEEHQFVLESLAYPFMEVTGDVVISWMLLWRATIASNKLATTSKKKDSAFYQGQLKSVEFFINSILPITIGKMNTILTTNGSAIEISEESFGG